ncbi:MAG TPA: hypothetical protein VFA60_01190 [Terriglobales bacterium]|nr:hypothetical protein [Terriglobales bacterium]
MSITKIEQISGELSATVFAEIRLAPGTAVEDGTYTLRYSFDGQQSATAVRIKFGHLLAAHG